MTINNGKKKEKAWYELFMSMNKDDFSRISSAFCQSLIDRKFEFFKYGDHLNKKHVDITVSDIKEG